MKVQISTLCLLWLLLNEEMFVKLTFFFLLNLRYLPLNHQGKFVANSEQSQIINFSLIYWVIVLWYLIKKVIVLWYLRDIARRHSSDKEAHSARFKYCSPLPSRALKFLSRCSIPSVVKLAPFFKAKYCNFPSCSNHWREASVSVSQNDRLSFLRKKIHQN